MAAPGETADVDVNAEQRSAVSIVEVLSLAAAIVVGLVSLAALALAHFHRFSLAAVMTISIITLLVVLVLVVRVDAIRPRLDLPGLVPAVVGAGLSALYLFPGFQYGTGDRDPGAYIEIGAAIARTHGLPFPDPAAAAGLQQLFLPDEIWQALWIQPGHPGQIFPQFYHLWPALLAVGKDAGGFSGMFAIGPVLGLLAVVLAVAIGRRIAGMPGAWTVALLLPTNMLEVWQAKYPTAEIFGQMLFLGAMLGIVLAVRCRWRAAAALGGILLGLGYLERPDGILLILLAWGGLGALLAVRKFDARAGWFTAGMVVTLPYGFIQAYVLARHYTLTNGVPRFTEVAAAMVGAAILGGLLAAFLPRWRGLLAVADRPRVRTGLGTAFIVVCALLVLLGGLRPLLFGKQYGLYLGRRIRTYNEISFIRLTWFFSLTGIALMCAGIAYVGWRRWRLDRWLIALATAGLLTLYCYNLRNSPYLMWSTRRFVTTVVPGMVLLMGCGSAGVVLLVRRWLPRVLPWRKVTRVIGPIAVAGLLAGLAVFQSSESWPLRYHDENGGSITVEQHLSALSGSRQGVYLWQNVGTCCGYSSLLFGGPLFTIFDEISVFLPPRGAYENAAVSRFVQHYSGSGQPIFYVAEADGAPPVIPGVTATKVTRVAGSMPHWEETYVTRPDRSIPLTYSMTVYRLRAADG